MPHPNPPSHSKLPSAAERMIRQVEKRQARTERAQSQKGEFWRALTILGLVGWSVVIPTLVGAALGSWIDRRWPSRVSWTLMLLAGGLVLGCANAWLRIRGDQP